MKLTIPGRAGDAAAHLVLRSSLQDVIDDRGGTVSLDGTAYVVELPDFVAATLSSGELVLWNALESLEGSKSFWLDMAADRLDERNLSAIHAAIGILFGLTPAEVCS